MISLHLGDCFGLLDRLDNQSVDAVITDPPYCAGGISESQRTSIKGQGLRSVNLKRFGWFVGDNMGTAGLSWLLREVAVESHRFLKPSGHFLFFLNWRMVPALVPAVESAGLRYQNLISWDKQSFGLGAGFRPQHELIAHFTTGNPEYHSRSFGNVLRHPRVDTDDREHQTQKPIELLADLIRVVSPEGGAIADPFMGSGSTGVAAALLERSFYGSEQDPEHFATARRRIDRPHDVGRKIDKPCPLFAALEEPA